MLDHASENEGEPEAALHTDAADCFKKALIRDPHNLDAQDQLAALGIELDAADHGQRAADHHLAPDHTDRARDRARPGNDL